MNSKDTSNQSCSSDHRQALLALQDLVEVLPIILEPAFVSALQQARMVLKKQRRHTGSST